MERETELCELTGTPLPVDKIQRFLRGNFSKLNWQDLLLLASPICESLAQTLGLAPNAIRSEETIELSDKFVRPVIRMVATGNPQLPRSRIVPIVVSTMCILKNENPSQLVMPYVEYELPENAVEQIQKFLKLHGEKRLDGQVQFAIDDGKVFTMSGKLGPKPVEDISTTDTKTLVGVVDCIAYSTRETKVRSNGSRSTTPTKFDLSQLKMLCSLLESQRLSNFTIGPCLDAQGRRFDVLLDLMPLDDEPLQLVSQG